MLRVNMHRGDIAREPFHMRSNRFDIFASSGRPSSTEINSNSENPFRPETDFKIGSECVDGA